MKISIRQARTEDVAIVVTILTEAAWWLADNGKVMWRDNELVPERIAEDVHAGLFFLAECDGRPAGTVKFQLEDKLFWPDVPQGESAFIHRLAVRREFAGGGVSTAVFEWAMVRAQSLGKLWLRLDCEASRPRLRAIYERFGFQHHSDRAVGPYFVSRYECKLRS